ncbi:AbgT family transporter [Actinoalloteichus caeruleus]|uniref:Aminobenzoyl-glutamate transport protein n=1 Tax=Actinoalloteichus caeruleus DSM 43889 TaxID=1120930 RepID=A0ABT1JKM3_ACTCY|nr:AbgT family transporter [Actinoalloteichus caeruleus]MCP2333045.1 aminobenzoyl-glutamate transport protein [Actinoalloteichus caeruleus DSM 43889]
MARGGRGRGSGGATSAGVGGVLGWIERVGNRLPEPFVLFALLTLLVGVVSTVLAAFGAAVVVPGEDGVTEVRGGFSAEGIRFLFTEMPANFIGFPPMETVVTIMLAVGLAERTGMLTALVRIAFARAPRGLLPYAVGFVGVSGSVMSDSVFIVVPPLAAMVFRAAGRHPVAGLLGGFAAAGAGYSTSVLVTSLDALFAGITNSVVSSLAQPGTEVTALSNYYVNVVSAVVLSLLVGVVITRVVEPGLERSGFPRSPVVEDDPPTGPADPPVDLDQVSPTVTAAERRGLAAAGLALLTLVVMLGALALWPSSPLRAEDGGYLPSSPLLSSVTTLTFLAFAVPAIAYGATTGAIRTSADVPRLVGLAVRDLSGFIVLAFALGQFVALFGWTNIGTWLAVRGAEFLRGSGLEGYPALVGFVLLASVLNLLIISGSSLWTLLASVFVPMFLLVGFEPGFTQALFRAGDSVTQVITPMNPYVIVLLTFVRRYQPTAGLGTVIARMLPFVVPFWVAWLGILTLFYVAELPLGPGMGVLVGE